MKYLERLQNKENQESKVQEQTAKRSKLQAQADLLEVESQIAEEEAKLDILRLAEADYSLTRVAEQLLRIKDFKLIHKEMEKEFKSEF